MQPNQDMTLDPVRWLQGLRGSAFPVLLDSGQPDSPSGRFSVLAAEPRTIWKAVTPQSLEVWQRDDRGQYRLTETRSGPVFDAFTALHTRAAAPKSDNGCFNGGLIGVLPYELGAAAHGLVRPPLTATDLDADVRPDTGWGWVGDYDRALVIDHGNNSLHRVGTVDHWSPANATPTPLPATAGRVMTTSLERTAYMSRLQRIRDYLLAGDIYQVNLTRQFRATWNQDPISTFATLRQATPTPYSGYLDMGDQQLLSLSPERFVRIDQHVLETRPIKGTRPRGDTPEQDQQLRTELQHSEKDRAENLMIVDLLRNDLGRTAVTGSVRVPTLFAIESYANVHQLVSTVTATLDPALTPLQALAQAFPGGSITGAPKKRAMEIIRELEPHSRGPYCGTLFYQDVTGRLDSNILIRSALIREGILYLWSGGGIVWDSEPDAEYQETHDKIRGLASALGLTLP